MKSLRFLLLSLTIAAASYGQEQSPAPRVAVPEQKTDAVANDLAITQELAQEKAPLAPVAPTKQLSPIEIEEARLSELQPLQLDSNNVPLRSAVRWLADQCGMQHFGLPVRDEGQEPVSFSVYANPYEVLKSVVANNGLGMQFERGMWHFYYKNNNETIARIYQLKHNTMEKFDLGDGGGSSGQMGGSTNSNSSNALGSSYASNGTGSSGSSNNVRSNNKIKSDSGKELVEAIESFLQLDTTAAFATFLEEGAVGEFFPISQPDLHSSMSAGDGKKAAGTRKGSVRYLADNNQLYILATRQQHEYIEGFLEAVDKPQKLIAIETKIIETSRDLSRDLGVEWKGLQPTITASSGGAGTTGGKLDLGTLGNPSWPSQAILSATDVSIGLRALAGDSRSSVVGYPRMVTINNRNVSLKSVVQRPVKRATTSASSGIGAQQTSISNVEEMDIGTVVDVYPKLLSDDNILLNVVISVSNVNGTVEIDGNPYPVVSNRIFQYQVIVKSGHTLAVGGLEETFDQTTLSKVPGLGDVPFFGMLFSKNNPARNNRALMLLVTPTILSGYSGGLTERPSNTISNQRRSERTPFQGTAREKVSDIRRVLGEMAHDIELLNQLALEGRAIRADVTRVDLLKNELDLMSLKLTEEMKTDRVLDADNIRRSIESYQSRLKSLRQDVAKSAKFAGA